MNARSTTEVIITPRCHALRDVGPALPFTASDPWNGYIAHCKTAAYITERSGFAMCQAPSLQIIMKLLHKITEERIRRQSVQKTTFGVCLLMERSRGRGDEFVLGQHDTPTGY